MMNISFKCIEKMNAVAESGVIITEEEAKFLMELAVRDGCRISQEKVKMIARNSGLSIFDDYATW